MPLLPAVARGQAQVDIFPEQEQSEQSAAEVPAAEQSAIPTFSATQPQSKPVPSHESMVTEAPSDEEVTLIIMYMCESPTYDFDPHTSRLVWGMHLRRVRLAFVHCVEGRSQYDGATARFVQTLRGQIKSANFVSGPSARTR